jgi:hypothetical protein
VSPHLVQPRTKVMPNSKNEKWGQSRINWNIVKFPFNSTLTLIYGAQAVIVRCGVRVELTGTLQNFRLTRL